MNFWLFTVWCESLLFHIDLRCSYDGSTVQLHDVFLTVSTFCFFLGHSSERHKCDQSNFSTDMTQKQGPQEQDVKFQDQIFSEFQDICQFHEAQDTEMHVFLCTQILISQADQYCCHKNATKAMLHTKQW